MEELAVIGCALKEDLGRISVRGLRNARGLQGGIFAALADRNIVVDDIMQTEQGDATVLAFTVDHGDLADAKQLVAAIVAQAGAEMQVEVGLSKVSVVGVGMKSHAGVASRMFRALGDVSVLIHNITTSEIKISCIVDKSDGQRALDAVHAAFGLALGDDATIGMQTDAATGP